MPPSAGEAAAEAARHAEAVRVHETCAMFLAFIRTSFPSCLKSSTHPPRPSDIPVKRLLPLLCDGVLLADIISTLSPINLPKGAILRADRRNAISLPSSARPVDERQRDVQYRANTRKTISAVRKLLEEVRANASLVASPNSLDQFVVNVVRTNPERDVRPVLKLAEVVIACAVYGKDGNKYLNPFWDRNDNMRMPFHKAMMGVAHAVYLPMPDVLYAQMEMAGDGLVTLERKHEEEVNVEAIKSAETAEGPDMGGRKFSLITEEGGGGSRGSASPERGSGEEEFFTPREHSPSNHPVFSPLATRVGLTFVDEKVRESVTTSITKTIAPISQGFEADSRDSEQMSPEHIDVLELGKTQGGAHAGVELGNASYLLSPEGSDAPAPSNQWHFLPQQKKIAEEVLSPQQLFSPPRMPRQRRSSRKPIATQNTPPPGPPLFRADSPHLSVSSAGGAVQQVGAVEGAQYLGKAPRVSFAPNIISPGGHQRPLGKPLKNVPTEVHQEHTMEKRASRRGNDFSNLPPSAAGASSQMLQTPVAEQLVSRSYDNQQESSGAGQGSRPAADVMWADDSEENRDGEDYDEEDEEDDEDDEVDTNESVSSEKPSLEDVEEFAVASGRGSSRQGESSEPTVPGSRECSRSGPSTAQNKGKASPTVRTSDPDIDFTSLKIDDVGQDSGGLVHVGENIDDFELGALFDEKAAMEALNYNPGMSPIRTPVPSSPLFGRSSIPREVPPTPPSPPTVASLVESITARKQTPGAMDARPVSTMEPSAGLFKKLIAVWQNSEEYDHRDPPGGKISEELTASHIFGPEATTSYSTQESTIPSGDTEADLGRPRSHVDSPRSRRRRGVRLESGSPAMNDLQRVHAMSDDSGHPDEKGSVASFSDAFSSDKERTWLYGGHTTADGYDWEEAMRGDQDAGIPVSSSQQVSKSPQTNESRKISSRPSVQSHARPPLPPSPRTSGRKSKSHGTNTSGRGVITEGQHIKVDRRRLDWLTRELLSARDAISRQELQMTFAETQRMEQEEVLLLDKQNAEYVVDAMKHILTDREVELKDARGRLSVAIQSVSGNQEGERVSRSSATSVGGDGTNLKEYISERHAKLHSRLDVSEKKRHDAEEQMASETRGLWAEVQRALTEKMVEMTERRDAELEYLRTEIARRQNIVDELQKSRAELRSKHEGIQSDMHVLRLEKEKDAHRYQMEVAHVGAQVELVNEFSKKLHDNFRETENLRLQVLQYQDKLAHITSTSGVSQRQIKELREAVTRANDECARLRREADMAKRAGREAILRAEELEELRREGGSASRFPDRQDRSVSGSFHSHEPVRPAGQNRPGGTGPGARYHNATRGRGVAAGPTPAQKAWLVIKDKIGGIVTGKESHPSRRRPPGQSARTNHRSPSAHSGSRSSGSRSRRSPREEELGRGSRSPSVKSRSSHGSGSSVRSGLAPRSVGSGRRGSPASDRQYMHDSPRAKGEVSRIRAVDF